MKIDFRTIALILVGFVLSGLAPLQAQTAPAEFAYDKAIWPDKLTTPGVAIAWNGSAVPNKTIDRFYVLAAEDEASIVSIWLGDTPDATARKLRDKFADASSFDQMRIAGNDSQLPDGLVEKVSKATGVVILGTKLTSTQSELLRQLQPELEKLLAARGIVLLAGEAFSMAGRIEVAATPSGIATQSGLDVIPGTIIHKRTQQQRGLAANMMNPRLVSISIPNDTGIILRGRQIRVIGSGQVDFRLLGNDIKPQRSLDVAETKSRRPRPYADLIDLPAWRRDAIDRTLPEFPPQEPAKPFVENGSLIIIGGGGTPASASRRFIELAGGKDAKLIYIPCSSADQVAENRLVRRWRSQVASAHQFHTKDREKADTDEEFLKELSEATGIWFGGGRQWNFVDSYYGTTAHKLMLEVLDRGGVIAGSSAGASIQGEYLARANPVANFDIMAPGYERGLGFLQGVAIDQHFTQRRRQSDMTKLADTYPQLLGIGIDESTAIVVNKSEAEVIGRGRVFFYDRNQPVIPGEDDFIALEAGQKFDLGTREVIEESDE